MAHAFARAMNVSPWEALLGQLYLLQGQVAWLTAKVAQAPDDASLLRYTEGENGEEAYGRWVELLEQRGDRLTKVAKMAIDAGIAQQMVNAIEDDAQRLYVATKRAAALLGLDEDKELELVATIAQEYAKELTAGTTIEGETVGDGDAT